MSSPCGKCDACPCSGQSNQQEQKEPQQAGSIPPEQQPKPLKRARVECRCVPNKDRRNPPVQAPLADTYTCLRPHNQPTNAINKPEPPMCTCKQEPVQPQCECDPAPPPPPKETPPPKPPTHAYITCGTPTPTVDPKSCSGRPIEGGQSGPPRYEPKDKQFCPKCPHCDAPKKKKKKCVIL